MRRLLLALRRSPLAALLVLVAIAACSGIITGPDAGPDVSPRSIRITPTSLALTLGQTATLTAQLYDVTGAETAPEAGRSITFVSANEAVATVTPDGVVVPVADGTVLVRAEYGVLALGVPVRVLGRPRLVIVDGDAQSAEQRDPLPRRLVVRALDASSQPVVDAPVTFAVITGGGIVNPVDARTDVTGVAQALWTLGLPLGAQTARATAVGFDPVDFTATATQGTRPARIGLANARSTLVGAGDAERIVGVVYNVANVVLSASPIDWSSNATAVAAVDQTGTVTAVAPGETYIRAVSQGARDSVRIEVLALPVIGVTPATIVFNASAGSTPAATTIAVANTGGSVLTGLSASVAYGAGANGWLGLALDATTAPAVLTVTPATTTLAAGVYTATITVASTVPRVMLRTVNVTLTVTSVAPAPKLALGADTMHPAELQDDRTLTLPAAAAAPLTVRLRSTAAENVLLAPDATTAGSASVTLNINAGESTARYWIQGVEGRVGGAAELIAEAAGYASDTVQVTVTRPAVTLALVGAATIPAVGGDDPVLRVVVGANEGGVLRPLPVRAFGTPALVSVIANSPALAQLRFRSTAATVGADQGPDTRVEFALSAGRSATLLADPIGGVLASLSVVRSGIAGAASFSLTSAGNAYQRLGSDPTLALTALPVPVIAVMPASIALNATDGGTSPAAQAVSVTNTGGGTLSGLSASVAYGAGANGWLAVALDQNTAPATLSITPSTAAVPAGSYSATITIASSAVGVLPVDVGVTLTVAANVLPKLDLGADVQHPASLQIARRLELPLNAAANLTVTLRSLDATAALLSAAADAVGIATDGVQVLAGTNAATWYLHGVEGAAGRDVTLIAEAPGLRPDTLVVSIVRPAVLLGQRGPSTVAAVGGEDPILDVTVGGLSGGGLFSVMRVRPGGVAPTFTLSSNTPATALLRHVATPFTIGADQGPDANVTFALAPGRAATSIGEVSGIPATLRLARTGSAGLASVSLVSQPAEYSVAGTGSVSFTLTGIVASPRMVIVSGNSQSVAWDQLLPDSLVVQVLDGNDAPVSGVTVDFSVSANGGAVSPLSSVADANGRAATQWRMSTVVGAHTVTATAAGFASVMFDGASLGGTVVTRVAITAGRTTLTGGPGDRETFAATAFNRADSIITSKPIIWTSSAPLIVRVDSAGNLVALAVGQASIRAAVDLGIAEVLVTVPANPSVTLGARAYTAAGLMREVVETFAAPAPVAFFLTLRSADPLRALVSTSAAVAGTASVTVPVAVGTSTFVWWLHGLEGLSGDTVSVIAENNGFAVDTVLVTVVRPLMRIAVAGNLALPASGGRDPWFAVTIGGEVEPVGASLSYGVLPVRAGATPPVFVLSSSSPAVAQLRFRPTPNTTGVAQGPANAVTFGIAPGFPGTFLPLYDSGELPSLELSRPGAAGTATIQLAGPAGYLLDGIEPVVTTTPVGPPSISLALVGTPLLGVNGSATVRATLAQPAPVGGVAVTLVSGDVNRATVDAPATATIAAGATTAEFLIRGVTPGSVTLTASASGYADGTLSVGVSVLAISVPLTLNLPFTRTASLPITLPQAAPPGGTTVTVTSADPSTVLVLTPTVLIPAGAVSRNAQLQGLQLGVAVVSASVPNVVTGNTSVRVTAVLDIVESTISMSRGFSVASFTTRLLSDGVPFAAPAGGIPLTFVARNPACVAAPSGATVAAGQNSVVAVADYGGVAPLSCTTLVVVTSPQFDPDSVQITVQPQPTSSLALSPTLAAGLSQLGYLFLGLAAPAGGVTVTLSSSDASRLVVAANGATVGTGSADIFLPAGSTLAPFSYSAIEGQAGTTAQITAAIAGGLFAAPTPVTVTVNPIGIELFGTTSLTTLGGDGSGSVIVGELGPPGPTQQVSTEAVIRAGGQPLTITLTSSALGVLLPVIGGAAASPGTVTIAVGSSRASYGIRPLSAGTGVITATSAGAGSPARANYPAPITVTQPTSTLALSTTLAAGLSQLGYLFLGNAAPAGGVTVTLSSSDASRLVVAATGATVGTGSADIFLPAGSTLAPFSYSAIEGQGGTTAQLSAVVQGGQFANPAPATVNIGVLGVEASGTTSLTTLGQDGSGTVYLGTLGAAGPSQSVSSEAVIRTGGQSVTVTLTSSAPSVAVPVVAGVAASPRTVTILVGQSRASYAIRPITAGTTTIGATATNADAPARAGYPATITVTSPTTSLVMPPRVGAGLASNDGLVFLQVAAPAGGVTVRLTSSDPTRLLLAPNLLTAGAATIDLFIPQGGSFVSFASMGLEDVTGSPTVTAQTPGYTDATATTSVESIGVQWFGVSSLLLLGGDGSGGVNVGVASGPAGNRTITPEQEIRFGGVARTITITSSDPSVVLPVAGGIAQQDLTVTILPGQSRATVAVRPVGPGTATIAATGPGLLPAQTSAIPQAVTVTVPSQYLSIGTFTQGAGLAQSATIIMQMAIPAGGRTLTLTSSDPTRLLVAPDATTAGAGEIGIAFSQGTQSLSFVLMAPESVIGSVSLLARTPGYRDTTFTFTVSQPAVTLNGPSGTRTIAQGDVGFEATVGVPSGDNVVPQFVRFGAPASLVVTLTSSAPSIGTLVVGGVAASPQTVQILPGQSTSPSVGATRASFRPLGAGNTTIGATIAGYLQQNNAIRTVVVSP